MTARPATLVEEAAGIVDTYDRRIEQFDPTVPGFTNPRVLGMLYSLILEFRPESCVELGSYMGRSATTIASALASLGGDRKLVCVDLFDAALDPDYFKLPLIRQIMNRNRMLKERYADPDSIRTISDAFDVTMSRVAYPAVQIDKRVSNSNDAVFGPAEKFEFSYIDAGHSYEDVGKDFLNLLPHLTENHVAVFDDYSTKFPGVVDFVDQVREFSQTDVIGFEHPDIAVRIKDPTSLLADMKVSGKFDGLLGTATV